MGPTATAVCATALLLPLALSCSGGSGGSSEPITTAPVQPELALCRSEIDRAHQRTETILRTTQNLGDQRIPARAGAESGIRVSPDGALVAFARERTNNDPDSREIYVAPVDNSASELRVTANGELDDSPCWAPDNQRVLFSAERGGPRRLWLSGIDANRQPQEFLTSTEGGDTEPDWHWDSDRIVFSRLDSATGRWRLMLVQGNGTGLVPLTDGGTVGPTGDRQPCFHPDGTAVTFVREDTSGRGNLWTVAIGSGTVTPLLPPNDHDIRRPRWSPHGDRLFAAVSDAAEGRPGLRLCQFTPTAQGTLEPPILLAPDKRYAYPGIDVFPDLPPLPAADPAPQPVPYADGQVIINGLIGPTDFDFLRERDQTPVIVATTTIEGRELAGININTPLPQSIDPGDVLQVQIKIVAALRRPGGGSLLRATLRNHVERRFDTVIEVTPADTGYVELSFTTASLAHVDRRGYISTAIIADVDPGARTELWVDSIEIEVVVRAPG